jgi:hypothetical protein
MLGSVRSHMPIDALVDYTEARKPLACGTSELMTCTELGWPPCPLRPVVAPGPIGPFEIAWVVVEGIG